MKKRSIGCQCDCEAECGDCGGCIGTECVISNITGWRCSLTTLEQSGPAYCVDGDWRVPVGPDGEYVEFDRTDCSRGWTTSFQQTGVNPNTFATESYYITGTFPCHTCNGAQTGIAICFPWEDDGVAVCSFTGSECGTNDGSTVCDAPDDDCAETDQICEKVSITSFTAENDHADRVFEFDQIAGYKPYWYDSNKCLIPCTSLYTSQSNPSTNTSRTGCIHVEGIAESYSNSLKMYHGRLQVEASNDPQGIYREVGNPCSGGHGGTEECKTALLGLLGDMTWSYDQVANECADEPSVNCCGDAGCSYTGMTAFTINDVPAFGGPTYEWVMQSVIKTSPCTFTMTMDDVSGNGGGTTTWYLSVTSFFGGYGKFDLEPAFGDTYQNGFINVTFVDCNLVQNVIGLGNFGVNCPITATFVDTGTC